MSFSSLGLESEITSALAEEGYAKPSTIQRLAIPKILSGSDLIASAQTGTGKTAGFVLPLLQKLKGTKSDLAGRPPRALILTPTRELAQQINQKISAYSKNLSLKTAVIYGGVDYKGQLQKLERGVDIIVGTPGRLVDLLEGGYLKLHKVNYLVLDEADRMLDMGFAPIVRRIIRDLPRSRQTVLFSATYSNEVKNLAQAIMKSPASVQAEKSNSTAQRVSHMVHPVDHGKKRALLSYLIGSNNWQQVLIFTRTKVSADKLSKELYLDGIKNMVIHGDRTQGQRSKALQQFKEGKIQALVATDIAARGIDIVDLPYVINYELPNIPEDYVHRVGRTGRAGQSGLAVTLVTDKELYLLEAVERLIKLKIDKTRVPGFEPVQFDPQAATRTARGQRRRAPGEQRVMKSGRSLNRRTSYKGTGSKKSSGPKSSKKKSGAGFSKTSKPKAKRSTKR